MNRGLLLVGIYRGTSSVNYKDGKPVPNMFKIELDCSNTDRPWIRDAAFFDVDQQTGQLSRVAEQLGNDAPKVGDLIAVQVSTSTSAGSQGRTFVNLTVLGFEVLEAAKPLAAAK